MGKGKRKREDSSIGSSTNPNPSTNPSPITMKERHKKILLRLIDDAVSGTEKIDRNPRKQVYWDNLTRIFNTRIQTGRRNPFHGYSALEVTSCARELKAYYKKHKNDENLPVGFDLFEKAFGVCGRCQKLLSIPSEKTMMGLKRGSYDRRTCSTSGQTSCQNTNSITDLEMAIVHCVTALRSNNFITLDEAWYGVKHLNSAGEESTRALFMTLSVQDQIASIKKFFDGRE
ncbi:hypothetical protein RND81_05G001000 [Saponaria officinalis]|uniref:Myb/SANT-like domain-containing protein n=1 Tax=Saponaria officinalis TaxID=3572 RepID=A0AAW1KRN9_SAPOF